MEKTVEFIIISIISLSLCLFGFYFYSDKKRGAKGIIKDSFFIIVVYLICFLVVCLIRNLLIKIGIVF